MTEINMRVKQANAVINAIASVGPRLLYSPVYERVARFGLDKHQQIWYLDCATGMKLHPFGIENWPGFTSGAMLKELVERLANYINGADPVPVAILDSLEYGAADLAEVKKQALETEAVTGDLK